MELSDIVLRRLSSNLGSEWEKLASYLGFSQADIEQFTMDSTIRGIENAMFSMLVAWRETKPVQTTNYRKELRSALEKCGRCDLADLVHEDSPKSQLDVICSSLCSKLDNKPELFEDAIAAFYTGYVSMTTDSDIAAALINFGQSAGSDNEPKEESRPKKFDLEQKITQLRVEDDTNLTLFSAKSIALHPSGAIAVVDSKDGREGSRLHLKTMMYLLAGDGSHQRSVHLTTTSGRPVGLIANLRLKSDVVVTKQGYFAIADNTTQVKLRSIDGEMVGTFSTGEGGGAEKTDRARCIAVSSNGEIYVGDYSEQVITVHDPDDLSIRKEINVSIKPCHIAVNSNGQVCVVSLVHGYDWSSGFGRPTEHTQATVFDDSGNEVFTLSPMVWGKKAIPLGGVYDDNDTLMLAVLDRSIKKGGHVHRYGKKGEFLECIINIKELELPSGLALRDNSLAIADGKAIVVYKGKPTSE